jgi:DNA-binding response OmpR family regulator
MRALVIEDNECLRELFQIFLEKLGFQANKSALFFLFIEEGEIYKF